MKKICVKIAVLVMQFVNLFFRPLKIRNKVSIISRQSDYPTLDIQLLQDRLYDEDMETVVLCSTLKKSVSGLISYGKHLIKQMYHIATSKVVVLDGYCILASILPKKDGQSFVQMWHALGAVKKFGWQSVDNPDGHSRAVAEIMKMHRNYDYVLAPCRETGGFFAEAFRTPEDKMVYLGLPRLDYIRTPNEEVETKIRNTYPEIQEKVNVLYVPTFRKHAALELERLIAGFDFTQMNFIIKKHFLDHGDYSWAVEKGALVDDTYSSMDWMKICEKVVTDYSAISFEAASIGRELYIFQPDVEKYASDNGLNIYMEKEAIHDYVAHTEEELINILKKPYDRDAVYAFRDKWLAIDREDCTGSLCRFIMSLLQG